jgi:plastocyanin
VNAAVNNARAFSEVQKEFGSFNDYLWSFVGRQTVKNAWRSDSEIPARSMIVDRPSGKSAWRRSLMILVASLLTVTVLVACGGPEPEADQEMQESETQETEMQQEEEEVEEVTLKVGTFVPHRRDFISAHSVVILPEILEEQSPGMFNIEHAGGPETFPPFELYGYVEDGTIDMASLPTAFYGGDIFLAVVANFPDMTPGRLREIGLAPWYVMGRGSTQR